MTQQRRAKDDPGGQVAPEGEMTPGQHLQAIHQAFFNGGGWVDPLTWDDYDEAGHAKWEVMAEVIGRNTSKAAAAPDLLAACQALVEEKVDYMLLNKLGNPEDQHTVRLARHAIALALPESALARFVRGAKDR